MKFAILILCIAAISDAIPSTMDEWTTFKVRHGKSYKSKEEEAYRHGIYMSNKQMIEEHNAMYKAGKSSYEIGVNRFTDKLPEEINAQLNGFNRSGELMHRRPGLKFISPENVQAPSSIDWRQKGAVTPVKDQGSCGSCWAFSTTGSLEGQIFEKTGKLVSLSEQNLVDCSQENDGCGGGLMDSAFVYIKRNGGIDSEESYPYEGEGGECRFDESSVAGTVSSYVDIPQGDEEALMKAVATVGPISVAINAGLSKFSQYKRGIFNERNCNPNALNHGVLLVGYGTENGQDYWLIKNSWNTVWGDEGYIKMARNQGNMCGVASMASYPVV